MDGRDIPARSTREPTGIAGRAHPGNQRLNAAGGARRGDRGEDVFAHRLLDLRALHVDDRRFARHRDCFFQRADFQLAVHRRDEVSRELDAFALDGAEARQRERHRIGARPQIHDAVLARIVADHRADLFDQNGACRFDGDAWQHRARRVFHDAGNGGLRARHRWQEEQYKQERRRSPEKCHRSSPHIQKSTCTLALTYRAG